MGKVQIQAEIDMERLLSQLETNELEAFQREVSAMITRRKTKDIKIIQTRLLQRLNEECVLSDDHWSKFRALLTKKEESIITPEELEAFAQLTEEEEALRLKRIMILGELAQLRGISLIQISQQLGIESPQSV